MNRLVRQVRRQVRRRGVALVLVLGVLFLMVLFAGSFTAAATFSRQVARMGESVTQARLHCQTAVQTLIASLKEQLADPTQASNLMPGTKLFTKGTGNWADYYYFVSTEPNAAERMDDGLDAAMAMTASGLNYFPSGVPAGVNASWLPIWRAQAELGLGVQVMVGRYAFLCVDETGKLEPTSVANSDGTNEGQEPLLGYTMSELDLTQTGLDLATANRLRVAPGGDLPASIPWFCRSHVARALDAAGHPLTQARFEVLAKTCYPFQRADTLEDRNSAFDLSTAGTSSTVAMLYAGIPWFKNFVPAGNFADAASRGMQLAANLRDYCDPDYDASCDNTTDPKYFGLEKVPYLSRVQFRFSNASFPYLNPGDGQWYIAPVLRVQCQPELLNLHGNLSSYATSCYASVQVEVKWKNRNLDERTDITTFTMNLNTATDTTGNFTANCYIRPTGLGVAADLVHPQLVLQTTSSPYALKDIRCRVVKMYLRKGPGDSGDWWDYGRTNANAVFDLEAAATVKYMRVRAYCPMSNLNLADWKAEDATVDDRFAAPYCGDTDVETPPLWTTYPLFIRNGPLQHLIELGALYRMEPFNATATNNEYLYQTLNLIDYKYNGDAQIPGDYSDEADGVVDNNDSTLSLKEGNGGDRNLLDLVRLQRTDTDGASLLGRLNINSQSSGCLRALFRRVNRLTYHYDPLNPAWQDPDDNTKARPIDQTKIDTLIANIMTETAKRPLQVALFSLYRNDPVYGLAFQKKLVDLPETEREYLLNMTRQLVTGQHNYFTVTVVAQVLKDIGAAPPGEMTINGVPAQLGRFDPGVDRIQAEQKVLVHLYRNAFNNRFSIDRFDYIDD